jgi:hypothetical protein
MFFRVGDIYPNHMYAQISRSRFALIGFLDPDKTYVVRYIIYILAVLSQIERQDPDPHQSDMLDRDPHQSNKLDLDQFADDKQNVPYLISAHLCTFSRFEPLFGS